MASGKGGTSTHFPICASIDDWNARGRKQVAAVSDSAMVDFVLDQQPFNQPYGVEDPLLRLQTLSNHDKHRLPAVLVAAAEYAGVELGSAGDPLAPVRISFGPYGQEREVLAHIPSAQPPEEEVPDIQPGLIVAFEDTFHRRDVMKRMATMVGRVSHVVSRARPFFPI